MAPRVSSLLHKTPFPFLALKLDVARTGIPLMAPDKWQAEIFISSGRWLTGECRSHIMAAY